MNIDEVFDDFASADGDLPRASISWALENWDAALPRFLDLLERYADGADRSEKAARILFYVFHLVAEKREAAAFSALCRVLKEGEAGEAILDDGITTTLCGILISAYDPLSNALQDLIETEDADEFVRGAALDAMSYLSARGVLSGDATRTYLLRLFEQMRPRGESYVWCAWASAAANLGYEDFSGKVEELCRRGFINNAIMDPGQFTEQLHEALSDPELMAGFKSNCIAPFEDTIGVLSGWYEFSEQRKLDEARDAKRAEIAAAASYLSGPVININRGVGRNDPCPCGSGKKYKKCCLA
jgi:hypothetical protein